MEQKNQTENQEYQFIREQVVSKKKSKVKCIAFSFLSTVFLAAVFGIVARAVYLYSDAPMRKWFGMEKEPSQNPEESTTLPSKEAEPSAEPISPSVGAVVEGETTPQGDVTPVPEVTPTAFVTPENGEKNPVGVPAVTGGAPTHGADSSVLAYAEQYAALFSGLQEVARNTAHSLVTLTVSVNGIDWLNNPYETQTQTTGIVIGKNDLELLILVNLDRIQSASRISLTLEKEDYEAKLWSYDKDYNLAVVRVMTRALPKHFQAQIEQAVFGDSMRLDIGAPILALGNPNGYIGSMEFGTVTSRASVYYVTDNSVELFNTSTMDSEDGDGVIVNLSGEIVGIITRTMKSGFDEAMCTAIGVSRLRSVIERLASGKSGVYLGIRGEDIPKEVLSEQGLMNGIYVIEVETDSPASLAGIKTGDIILQIDGKNIYSYSALNMMLNQYGSGTEVKIKLLRTVRMNTEQVEVTVVLGEK